MCPTSSSPTPAVWRRAVGSIQRRRFRQSHCAVPKGSGSDDASWDDGRSPDRAVALGKNMAGDDHLLDLAGTIVDLGHFRVSKVAFDVIALQVATAAEDLDGVRRVLHAVVTAEDL